MTQNRTWNFGDTFTSRRVGTAWSSLFPKGVLDGFDLSVADTDKVAMSAGFCMLPSGIILSESEVQEFVFSPLTASARTYTFTVRHTDADTLGGQAGIFAVETGELLPADVTNGVVLGYLYYPGGGVAIEAHHLFSARKVPARPQDEPRLLPSFVSAPFSTKWVVTAQGSNTQISDGFTAPYTYTSVETDGLGPAPPSYETTTAVMTFPIDRFRPVSIDVRLEVDANSEFELRLYDSDGTLVTLGDQTVSGPFTPAASHRVEVDPGSGVFTDGSHFALELEFRTPQLDSIEIQTLTINYDPLP